MRLSNARPAASFPEANRSPRTAALRASEIVSKQNRVAFGRTMPAAVANASIQNVASDKSAAYGLAKAKAKAHANATSRPR